MEKTDKAFFYGTLMAPQVLNRVCHGTTQPEPWQRDRMTIQPALLRGYRRHKVRYADYPAIVPVKLSEQQQQPLIPASGSMLSSSPSTPLDLTYTVRGTLVSGLTYNDFTRLDLFEGPMYGRALVDVQTQEAEAEAEVEAEAVQEKNEEEEEEGKEKEVKKERKKINAAMYDSHAHDGNNDKFNGETVKVQTYVWAHDPNELEPEEWSFEHFVRERLTIWAGTSGKEDFEEVDKAARDADAQGTEVKHDSTGGRGINGAISKKLEVEEPAQAAETILRNAV